ncbi:MAG: hypothetical protein IIB07_10470 [Bacteroidetes bacterium]|nr:hypothetical protein [Bacteroidota bacterium]
MNESFVVFYEYDDCYTIGTISDKVKSITKSEYKKLKEQNLESNEIKFVDLSKYQNKIGGVSLEELDEETYNRVLKLKSQKQIGKFEVIDDNRNDHWIIYSFDAYAKL